MIAQVIGVLAVGWVLGMATAMWLGARFMRQDRAKRQVQRQVMQDATGLAVDDEILEALEKQIARCKRAAAQVAPVEDAPDGA